MIHRLRITHNELSQPQWEVQRSDLDPVASQESQSDILTDGLAVRNALAEHHVSCFTPATPKDVGKPRQCSDGDVTPRRSPPTSWSCASVVVYVGYTGVQIWSIGITCKRSSTLYARAPV